MAAVAPVETTPDIASRWGLKTPQVRKAIRFIKRKGSVTPEELVAWDLAQPEAQRLFTTDAEEGLAHWRLHEARLFLNRFRAFFDNMRVRGFIHIRENEDANIPRAAYFTAEAISSHPGMREQVIADITKRMANLASELAMWNLSVKERKAIFNRLEAAFEKGLQSRKSA